MTHQGLIIVTGGGRGIGAAVCRQLAAEGYAVAVNYAAQAEPAKALVAELTKAGGKAAAYRGDVADEAAILALFAAAQDAFGPLVGLVNSAGILGESGRVQDLSLATLNRTFAVNVIGSILCAREAVRVMSTRNGGTGGAIVNLSSGAARLGGPGELVHYAASKGAIESFTRGLAREVADEGIRVNAVAPGVIDTDMNAPERQARIVPTVPIKRAGTAAEIAEAICWLLSPAASYVTGATLDVTGGR